MSNAIPFVEAAAIPRDASRPSSLDSLIGASPAELRALFSRGRPADRARLGRTPPGRLLAVEPLAFVHEALRPALSFVSRHLVPWQGKLFDREEGGANRVLGARVLPFLASLEPSELDGATSLFLRYERTGNPWPASRIVDELREVGDGIAIGPASLHVRGRSSLLFWWGLEHRTG